MRRTRARTSEPFSERKPRRFSSANIHTGVKTYVQTCTVPESNDSANLKMYGFLTRTAVFPLGLLSNLPPR